MSRASRSLPAFLLGVSLLAGAGCAGDGEPDVDTRASHVTGRVDAQGGSAAGVAIDTFALGADGTLSSLDATATTDAQGRYALDVALPVDAVALVVKSNGADVSAGLVSAAALEAAGDGSVTAPPLDPETTVATDVAMRALAAGDVATSLELQSLFLAPGLRAQIAAAAAYEAAVTATAAATADAAAAWTLGLAASIDGAVTGDAEAAATATVDASLALGAALDLAADDAAAAEAYAAYARATVEAQLDAGYGAIQVGVAAAAATDAMTRGLATVEDVSTTHLAVAAAIATTASVEAQATAITGADLDAIGAAGIALRAAVTAAMNATIVDTRAIGDAFLVYQLAVTTALSANLDVTIGAMTELLAEIDASAAALQAALADAGTDAEAIVAAHAAYHAEVASQAHVAILAGVQTDDATARAVLHVLAQVEAAGR